MRTLALLALLLLACDSNDGGTAATPFPGAYAPDWPVGMTQMSGCAPTTTHSDSTPPAGWDPAVPYSPPPAFGRAWLSDAAQQAWASGEALPDGAVALMEVHPTDACASESPRVVAGRKSAGEWAWQAFDEAGVPQDAAGCAGCHQGAGDGVWAQP